MRAGRCVLFAGVRRRHSSITLPREVKTGLLARARALDLPASRYVRHLLRNDQLAPAAGLAEMVAAFVPSKFSYAHLPLSLPRPLRKEAAAIAARHGLDFSPYVTALAVRDLARGGPFAILPGG